MRKKQHSTKEFINLIKVQDLRMVIALDEQGTILNAANTMGLSQPAITKRLQDLEKDLEFPLFHRLSRGVEPTPFGEIIIKHANIVLNQLRAAEGEVSDLSEGKGGRLRVGIPVSASSDLVSDAVSELLKQRKDVRITLVEDYNIRLIPSLKKGNLDLIVGRLPKKSQYEEINIESFYKESLKLSVRHAHPLAKKDHITIEDLASSSWILPPQDSILYELIEQFFRNHNLSMPQASVYSLAHDRNLRMLLKQDLIAAFPCESINDELSSGHIKCLNINMEDYATDVGILTRQGGFSSPAAEMFMDIIRSIGKSKANSLSEK